MALTMGEMDILRGKMAEAEDELSGQLVLLKEQLASEEREKEKLRATLSAQLESAQKRTGECGHCGVGKGHTRHAVFFS